VPRNVQNATLENELAAIKHSWRSDRCGFKAEHLFAWSGSAVDTRSEAKRIWDNPWIYMRLPVVLSETSTATSRDDRTARDGMRTRDRSPTKLASRWPRDNRLLRVILRLISPFLFFFFLFLFIKSEIRFLSEEERNLSERRPHVVRNLRQPSTHWRGTRWTKRRRSAADGISSAGVRDWSTVRHSAGGHAVCTYAIRAHNGARVNGERRCADALAIRLYWG